MKRGEKNHLSQCLLQNTGLCNYPSLWPLRTHCWCHSSFWWRAVPSHAQRPSSYQSVSRTDNGMAGNNWLTATLVQSGHFGWMRFHSLSRRTPVKSSRTVNHRTPMKSSNLFPTWQRPTSYKLQKQRYKPTSESLQISAHMCSIIQNYKSSTFLPIIHNVLIPLHMPKVL